jgi:hypothetical protein
MGQDVIMYNDFSQNRPGLPANKKNMKNNSQLHSISQMSFFLECLMLLLAFFILLRTPVDADMWWHLRAGQYMWEQKTILLADQFSYTRAGAPWVNAFWLADLGMYGLLRLGGFPVLSAAVSLIGVAISLLWLRRMNAPVGIRMALVLLGIFAFSPVMGPRPQLLSFLMLAILDVGLDRIRMDQASRRFIWLVVPLFILWANLHGGFIWGFLLLAAFVAGEILAQLTESEARFTWPELGRVGFWTAMAWLGTAFNPNGIALWKLPFYTVQISIGGIYEWASPDFHRADLHFMLWLIFLLLTGLGFSSRPIRWSDALKFIGFAYMAFVSQRSLGPFVVVAVPVVAASLAAAWEDRWKPTWARFRTGHNTLQRDLTTMTRATLNSIILASLGIAAAMRLTQVSSQDQIMENQPAAAVDWIRAHHPGGRLFNSYNWGGYLLWALPEHPVFIDGRADLYGPEIIGQWQEIVNGTDAGLGYLDQWNVNLILLEPGWPISDRLIHRGWKVLFRDERSVVYGR